MKQNVEVGALIHRSLLLYHNEGQGSCDGDSGGRFYKAYFLTTNETFGSERRHENI